MKPRKSVRSRTSGQSSVTTERERQRARAALLARIRGAVAGVLKPEDILGLLWDLGRGGDRPILDVDRIVDEFARTHDADGYRDQDMQKAALDDIQEELFTALGALPEKNRHAFNTFAQNWYSRQLLAVDVGFLMGHAAAKSLSSGGAQ